MSCNQDIYKRLGDYIQEVDVRNTESNVSKLVGLTIAKAFIPSVANTIGTDLSKYKIIKENQFACSLMQVSRDGKMPIAIYKGEDAIMSPAYPIFEVCREGLLPDYLQMWFSRPEFDREAVFYAVGGVRGSLDWKDFMDMKLPIPEVAEQQRIVDQYNAIQKRIENNKQTIAKLEDAAQAIYRKMFVDDIDPENLPEGWKITPLENLCISVNSGSTPKNFITDAALPTINYFKAESIDNGHFVDADALSKIDIEVHNSMKRSQIESGDILFSMAGTIGKFCIAENEHVPANTNQAICVIRTDSSIINVNTLFSMFLCGVQEEYVIRNIQEGVQANLSLSNIRNMPILLPPDEILNKYEDMIGPLISYMRNLWKENQYLTNTKKLITANIV